jgi:hypothetical protein
VMEVSEATASVDSLGIGNWVDSGYSRTALMTRSLCVLPDYKVEYGSKLATIAVRCVSKAL